MSNAISDPSKPRRGRPPRPPAPVPPGTTAQQFLALVQAGAVFPSTAQMVAALTLARLQRMQARLDAKTRPTKEPKR